MQAARIVAFVLCILATLFSVVEGQGQEWVISDSAYTLLTTRTNANREAFFVYKDADSGFNHGFPSGFFGSSTATLNKLHLEAACLDDSTQGSGCSSDLAGLDREHGTVLRLIFDPLLAGEFVGLHFEEPESWGVRQTGVGYDLRGSTALVFEARSPSGLRVQFGAGGSVGSFVTVPSAWSTITIPLSSLEPLPNLANAHLLFSVVTNDVNAPSGGVLLLDNIRFEPAPQSQINRLSFPLGTEAFGVIPRANVQPGRVPLPSDQVLRNLTTIYETALVILAFLDRGTPEDLAAARQLADAFDYALHHDNRGDPLPVGPDNARGLHSGYSSGDLALLNGQGPGAGRAGEVRLPGFTASTQLCGPTAFCLVLDGATGGNVAFAMLALMAAYEAFGEEKYLEDARILGRWIEGNLRDTTGTGYGGYFLGYPDQGVTPKPLIRAKSIENDADIFVAFTLLGAIERRLGNVARADQWRERAAEAGDFVMELYDPVSGCFQAGTVPPGTPPSAGIKPEGLRRGDDVVNTFRFLDANTFVTLAMAESSRYRTRIDWRRPALCSLEHFAVSVEADNEPFAGFNLVESPTEGPVGIAWEFTGQVVVTLRLVDLLYGEAVFAEQAAFYLEQIHHAQTKAPFGDGTGVVASTMEGGDALPPIEQCLSTPFQCIPERVGLAATAWAIFAERGFNPLSPAAAEALFLNEGRFRVTVAWRTAAGQNGVGIPVELTSDTGYFWFFNQENVELVIKVLNACPFAGHFWVFAGGLTNVEVTITVEDTATSQIRTYVNPLNTAFQPIQDTQAFATCPTL